MNLVFKTCCRVRNLIAESKMKDERYFCDITAKRKGRGQKTCTLKAGYTSNHRVVLRTIDFDGIAPIVALLDGPTARELAAAIVKAADQIEK